MSHKVYAPNIHFFAFHLHHSLPDDLQADANYDSELLWHKCHDIFAKFHIDKELKIRKVPKNCRVNLLEETTNINILLPLEGKIFLNDEQQISITGCACALQIYDSYALGLNLRIPEFDEKGEKTKEVELDILKHFNPDRCFLPEQIESSLGQTLLLTVWLSPEQQKNSSLWREIADECLQTFLGEGRENCPPLYQEGQLFGSPIFEYGIPSQTHVYGHILVWLFLGETANGKYTAKADENLELCYQEFIDLFFYRSKVIKAYQISREVHQDIFGGYQKIKQAINEIEQNISPQAQSLSETEMSDLKNKLKAMPQLALHYSDWLRELEKYCLTIEINAKNYTEKLRQIQEKSSHEDLSFLSVFNQEVCIQFQEQIKVDLGYFVPSSDLIDKAISSIRGIVEIEQAERDRASEEILREKEEAAGKREKSLQRWIALVGTGLAVSGISAQTDAKPVETLLIGRLKPNQTLDCPDAGRDFCLEYYSAYIMFHVLIGAIAASVLGLIIWLVSTISALLTSKSKNSSH